MARQKEANMSRQDEQDISDDERVVREYLESVRGEFWHDLPYRFFDLEVAWLDDSGFLPIPDDVFTAYERTRSDPLTYDFHAQDYARRPIVPMT
jgi:hypothetical protein